jgi:phage shock protein C
MDNKLYRSHSEKMIAGICGGLAQHFKIDVTLMRLVFIILFFFGGHGLLLYIILWIIMPISPEQRVVDVNPAPRVPIEK